MTVFEKVISLADSIKSLSDLVKFEPIAHQIGMVLDEDSDEECDIKFHLNMYVKSKAVFDCVRSYLELENLYNIVFPKFNFD
ncbi:hypothetical protein HOG98_05740 [bacterium]|nr:hypothetical protein [bacterium]